MILLITDDERTKQSVVDILADYFSLEHASDFASAHALLLAKEPSMVLIDYDLRTESGLSLFNRLKADFPKLKAIMLSVLNDIPLAVQAVKDGVLDFVRKPIESDNFIFTIKKNLSSKEEDVLDRNFFKRAASQPWASGHSKVQSAFLESIHSAKNGMQNIVLLGDQGISTDDLFALVCDETKKTARINLSEYRTQENEETFWITMGEIVGTSGTAFFEGYENLTEHFKESLVRYLQQKNKGWKIIFYIKEGRIAKEELERLFESYEKIKVPLIKERKEDLVEILDEELALIGARLGRPIRSLTLRALKFLQWYNFPGNYEELRAWLSSAVVSARNSEVDLFDLPLSLVNISKYLSWEVEKDKDWKLETALKNFKLHFMEIIKSVSPEEKNKLSQLLNLPADLLESRR